MNRAKPNHVVLHLLVSVALLVMASLVVAQSNRASAPRGSIPTVSAAKSSGRPKSTNVSTANIASKRALLATLANRGTRIGVPHTFIGKLNKLPRSITRRQLGTAQLRGARAWRAKGSTRVVGDTAVPRQTILLTAAQPSANFSITPSASTNLHPFWSYDETYIYFASDRVSATNSASNSTVANTSGQFNIYKTVTDGSSVAQVTTGTDQKLDPAVSNQNNLLAYVAGGQINNANAPKQEPQTTGFNLFILNFNAGTPLQLTNVSGTTKFTDVRHPSFAPGGADIVFAGKLQGDTVYHIWTINVASGTLQQYTSGPSNDYSPAWSPSAPNGSTAIVYTTNASTVNNTSVAPVATTATKATDDVWALQPITLQPSPRQITNFSVTGTAASNRNPAWSTTRLDNRAAVPNQLMLAFASTRADSKNDGIPDSISANGSTDIYYMVATVGPDPTNGTITTVTTPEVPFDTGGNYTGAHKLRTSNPEFAIDAVDKPGLTDFDPNHTSSEDFPAWPQYINSYRIAYQSDNAFNGGKTVNLWASTILDLDAPTLLKYDETNNEIVRVEDTNGNSLPNRFITAGSTVRFKVRAVDYESGVGGVYLQIKCPDSAPQSFDGFEHKIFYSGFGQMNSTTFVNNPPYEYDYQAIKASDTSTGAKFRPAGGSNTPAILGGIPNNWPGFNRYQAGVDDTTAFSGYLSPPDITTSPIGNFPDGDNGYWLQLTDDGSGTGTYTATWQTPVGFASDMVIDVILYDKAVDPFDTNQTSNWKIYDNIWGFTTRPFTSNGQVLYVDDYDSGQKFLANQFGNGSFTRLPNFAGLEFNGNPTESWMTEFDPALIPTTAISGTTVYTVVNFLNPLGNNSYADNLSTLNAAQGPLTGQYDIWRIQCRGAVPDNILNIYGPRTVTQPPDLIAGETANRTVTVADKCVIWHSPYPGDLFVGPGTILDSDVQARLTAFVNRGGRLFVNGQEIAFGLSLGQPGAANDFLNNTLRAVYVQDKAWNTYTNDKLDPPTEGASGTHPIAFQTWYDVNHAYPSAGGFEAPFAGSVYVSNTTINPTDHIYECPNTGAEGSIPIVGYPNQVTFNYTSIPLPTTTPTVAISPGKMYPSIYGVEAYYDPAGNNPAIMWWSQLDATQTKATGGRVVFSPIGWEALFPDFYTTSNPNLLIFKNRQVELMHNTLDLMRTGRIVGSVRVKNTGTTGGTVTTPIQGAFVRVQRADPLTGLLTTFGTALTQSDGSFVIEGLDPSGIYALDAKKLGYVTQHATGSVFHGDDEVRNDFYLIQAQPGVFTGTITTAGTNKPVPGILVQAVDNSTPPNTYVSAPSGTDGTYTIPNLPGGVSYTLSITNLAALGFGSSIPASIGPLALANGQALTGENFQVTQQPGTASGIVVVADAQGNPTTTPIANAAVTAYVTGTTTVGGTTTTAADGTYTLSLTPNSYDIQASAPGYVTKTTTAPISITTQVNTPNVNFALQAIPPGSLSGLITTSPPLSAPVAGATVTIVDAAGNTTTVTSGQVQHKTLPNGSTYTYNYVATGINAGSAASPSQVQVTAVKAGYTPKPNPDTQKVSIITLQETQNVNFVIDPLFTFSPNLALVSSPYEFTGSTIASLFGIPSGDINNTFAFVYWDGPTQKYVYYANYPADTFHLGKGYFMQETNSLVTLALTNPNGTQAPKDGTGNYTPFSIPLAQGWNLIGDPFVNSVDLSKLQIQDSAGRLIDVPTAQSGATPVLGSALFTYQNGSYQVVYTLDPFRGYWMYAYQPCTLIVTAGAQLNRGASIVRRATDVNNVSPGEWKIKLVAEVNETTAANAYMGIARNASDGFDRFKLLAPPAATAQNVQITFPHKDWGDKSANYMVDVRSTAASSWDFTVTSNIPNTPVVLSWPGIATVSRRQDIQLLDTDTNQTINLRNRSRTVIPFTGNTLTKHYRLTVINANPNQDLQLTNLTVLQGAGTRATGTPVAINYNLSADATVQISILQGGRHLRTLAAGSTRAAGNQQATWDLKTDQGASIPTGVYTVEVKAVHPSTGRVVRQTSSVLVTR